MRGLNFERRSADHQRHLERLLGLADDPNPPALFIESMPTPEHLPRFRHRASNAAAAAHGGSAHLDGQPLIVQTHYDLWSNIACVVGGRRRFTLFPPEQLPNLYIGPVEFTLSGTPISMVPLKTPDFARYPRFAEASRHA